MEGGAGGNSLIRAELASREHELSADLEIRRANFFIATEHARRRHGPSSSTRLLRSTANTEDGLRDGDDAN